MHKEDMHVNIRTHVPVFTRPRTPAQTFNVCKHTHGAFLSLEAEWFPGSTDKPLLGAVVLLMTGTSVFCHQDQILVYRPAYPILPLRAEK